MTTPQRAVQLFTEHAMENQTPDAIRFGILVHEGAIFVQNYNTASAWECVDMLKTGHATFTLDDWKATLYTEIGQLIQASEKDVTERFVACAQHAFATALAIGSIDTSCTLNKEEIKAVFIFVDPKGSIAFRYYFEKASDVQPYILSFIERMTATFH